MPLRKYPTKVFRQLSPTTLESLNAFRREYLLILNITNSELPATLDWEAQGKIFVAGVGRTYAPSQNVKAFPNKPNKNQHFIYHAIN